MARGADGLSLVGPKLEKGIKIKEVVTYESSPGHLGRLLQGLLLGFRDYSRDSSLTSCEFDLQQPGLLAGCCRQVGFQVPSGCSQSPVLIHGLASPSAFAHSEAFSSGT